MAQFNRKLYYNVEILYNKWAPFIVSGILILYHILIFLFAWDLMWILYICLPSLLTMLHMYNSRYTFKLCKIHRCFVNFVNANVLVCLLEHYFKFLLINPYWLLFKLIGIIFVLLLGLYYYKKEHGKINSRTFEDYSR